MFSSSSFSSIRICEQVTRKYFFTFIAEKRSKEKHSIATVSFLLKLDPATNSIRNEKFSAFFLTENSKTIYQTSCFSKKINFLIRTKISSNFRKESLIESLKVQDQRGPSILSSVHQRTTSSSINRRKFLPITFCVVEKSQEHDLEFFIDFVCFCLNCMKEKRFPCLAQYYNESIKLA